jgi:hypothetical protein
MSGWAASSWAARVPLESIAAVARLRRHGPLGISPQADAIWLRGNQLNEALDRDLRLIPGSRRFRVLHDGQLIAEGSLVPLGYVPKEPWHLLGEWLELAFPEATTARMERPRVQLQLVPSARMGEQSLLETTLAHWAEYVSTAPQWRIDRWSYVAIAGGAALVRGLQLPPLPGTQWVIFGNIAVPAGYHWNPPVEASVLTQLLQLAEHDLALLRPAGTWERINSGDWVKATRSSVRRTREAISRP